MSASLKDYRTHYISIPPFSIQSLFHSRFHRFCALRQAQGTRKNLLSENLFILMSVKTKIAMNSVSSKSFCAFDTPKTGSGDTPKLYFTLKFRFAKL
ncbi:MAG: hypothetical protein DRQ99_05155 [Candidatus Parabeggiatoa sp. nov. 3]|nr:MAG: hypothetical protein DRQ99_05155 [Gammaproteobacteria bacterium]